VILPEEIVMSALNDPNPAGNAPMLAQRVRVLELSVDPAPVLSYDTLEGQTAAGVDSQGRTPHKRLCEAALGIEGQLMAISGDVLACIATDKQPFAGLSFGSSGPLFPAYFTALKHLGSRICRKVDFCWCQIT